MIGRQIKENQNLGPIGFGKQMSFPKFFIGNLMIGKDSVENIRE